MALADGAARSDLYAWSCGRGRHLRQDDSDAEAPEEVDDLRKVPVRKVAPVNATRACTRGRDFQMEPTNGAASTVGLSPRCALPAVCHTFRSPCAIPMVAWIGTSVDLNHYGNEVVTLPPHEDTKIILIQLYYFNTCDEIPIIIKVLASRVVHKQAACTPAPVFRTTTVFCA